jgi:hypothetical protein
VGQPEFREILQRPEMEQFRQRVAATCHIGPLDQDETRGYIEHRLKCAGSKGKPSFGPGSFEAVHKATAGIPRRINAVCDRLLLAGFLGGRANLTVEDVAEVVREFQQENEVPARQAPAPVGGRADPSMPGGLAGAAMDVDIDVDLQSLALERGEADAMARQLGTLSAEQSAEQLQRLEQSLHRLERINTQTLSMLHKLVAAVKKPDGGGP